MSVDSAQSGFRKENKQSNKQTNKPYSLSHSLARHDNNTLIEQSLASFQQIIQGEPDLEERTRGMSPSTLVYKTQLSSGESEFRLFTSAVGRGSRTGF